MSQSDLVIKQVRLRLIGEDFWKAVSKAVGQALTATFRLRYVFRSLKKEKKREHENQIIPMKITHIIFFISRM